MKSWFKKTIAISFLLCVMIVPLVQTAQAYSPEDAAKSQFQSFLSDVIGFDLTKYSITESGYGVDYPSNLGGNVKEETVSYTFESGQNKADVWCIFDNGKMTSCSCTPVQGAVLYSHSPSTNAADEIRSVMQRYQEFASQYSDIDEGYLQQARSILDDAKNQKATEIIDSNMKIQISSAPDYTSIKWTYTENGIEMPFKSIKIDFRGKDLCWFGDSWSLYEVSTAKAISKDEAVNLGFAAAKSFPVHLAKFEGDTFTSVEVTPDWSNMTNEATLSMLPGTSFDTSLPTMPSAPSGPSYTASSKTDRDSLVLYPVWQLVFYFTEPIGNIVGVQVGVWGDTKEIAYCREYGYLGGSGTPPTPTTEQVSSQTQNGFPGSVGLAIALFIVLAATIVIANHLVIRKKRRK